MVEHTRVICLEEQQEYYQKYFDYFLKKYRMDQVMVPKILNRNIQDNITGSKLQTYNTTNEAGVFPSDNYLTEFLINERLLGFVYFRRNSFNNCEVVMVDLEIEIPEDWYKKSKHEE